MDVGCPARRGAGVQRCPRPEQLLRARESQPGAGDHGRLGRRHTLAAALADQLAAALDELVEQAPELVTPRTRTKAGAGAGASQPCDRARRGGGPRAQCGGFLHAGRLVATEPRRRPTGRTAPS